MNPYIMLVLSALLKRDSKSRGNTCGKTFSDLSQEKGSVAYSQQQNHLPKFWYDLQQ